MLWLAVSTTSVFAISSPETKTWVISVSWPGCETIVVGYHNWRMKATRSALS
jgi:hypothetical protein